MDNAAKIAAIRAAATTLRFETPTQGATFLTRLSYGLPPSEALPALSAAARAQSIIRRTIEHSHSAYYDVDQYGDGYRVTFRRHVTEGDQRWEIMVDVTATKTGVPMISDVTIERPPDPDDDETPAPPPPLTAAELLPFGMIACPCCGHATLTQRAMYQICPVCFWEDDGQDTADASVERGGPNRVSLVAGRASYLRIAASSEASRARRPPKKSSSGSSPPTAAKSLSAARGARRTADRRRSWCS